MPPPPPLEARAERHRLFAAMAGLLREIGRSSPLVLALEDLHCADPTTLQALHFLQRSVRDAPVLLVGTYRSEEVQGELLPSLIEAARQPGAGAALELQPLAPEGVARLLAALLGPEPVGEGLVAVVLERAHGNPLFVEELVTSWREGGHITVQERCWQLVGGVQPAVPAGIQALVAERLRGLEEGTVRLLRAGAVLGHGLGYPLLRAVSALAEEPLLDALDEAQGAGLLVETAEGYAFRHPLFVEALYQGLSARRRTLLHGRAAEALVRLEGVRADKHASVLARHFGAAGVHGQAAHYGQVAGEQAAAAHAIPEAVAHFTLAREHVLREMDEPADAEDREQAALLSHLDERLGDLRMLIGEYTLACEDFTQARLREPDPARRARLWNREATIWEKRGEFDRAVKTLDAAEAELLAAGGVPANIQATLVLRRAWSSVHRGFAGEARATAEAAIGLLDVCPDALVLADAYSLLGSNCYQQDDLAQAEVFYQRSLSIREQDSHVAANQQNIGRDRAGLGIVAWKRGAYLQAEERLCEALEVFERIGDAWGVAMCWSNRGGVAADRGRYAEATVCFRRALETWERLGEQSAMAVALNNLGGVALEQGHLAEAEAYLQRALAVRERIDARSGMGTSWQNLGDVALARGDLGQATGYYKCALASLDGTGMQGATVPCLIGQAGIARARGDLRTATKICRWARHLSRQYPVARHIASVALETARAYLHCGRLRAAAAFLRYARRLAEDGGLAQALLHAWLINAELALARADYLQARTAAQQALHLANSGPRRREAARACFLVGCVALAETRLDAAQSDLRIALAEQVEIGVQMDAATTRKVLATVLDRLHARDEAQALHEAALAAFAEAGAQGDLAYAARLAALGVRA